MMEKIPSFCKDHDSLQTGLYLSTVQQGVSTFDLRMKTPNGGDHDNTRIVERIVRLRSETAALLGHPSSAGPQLALMGVTWAFLGLAWLAVLVVMMDRIRPVFGRPAFQRWLNRTMGVILILFGLRLAAARS